MTKPSQALTQAEVEDAPIVDQALAIIAEARSILKAAQDSAWSDFANGTISRVAYDSERDSAWSTYRSATLRALAILEKNHD